MRTAFSAVTDMITSSPIEVEMNGTSTSFSEPKQSVHCAPSTLLSTTTRSGIDQDERQAYEIEEADRALGRAQRRA